MDFVRYRLDDTDTLGPCKRYIQPPQVGYLVTTLDKLGNLNAAPVTMGTCVAHKFFNFTLSNHFEENWDQDKYPFKEGVKQTYCNLREIPECVISYYGYPLLRESWIAGMPMPKGISEIEVAGLTPLPSSIVKPSGIAECPVNMEAKVLHVQKLGKKWINYTMEVVHVTVHKELDDKNKEGPMAGYGMTLIDPVFEVFIGKGNTPGTDNVRLVYDRLDFSKLERCPEDVGCRDRWIGGFRQWITEEQARGKLSDAEAARIFELERAWASNRNPAENSGVKAELTALLKKAVAKGG